jgi:hypothetical protein
VTVYAPAWFAVGALAHGLSYNRDKHLKVICDFCEAPIVLPPDPPPHKFRACAGCFAREFPPPLKIPPLGRCLNNATLHQRTLGCLGWSRPLEPRA